ncbi:hypothetical protein BEI59_23905 [Eisenbergiella tayi]|uniref:Radical SAM core domain-containing protein n=1 Tax=Eisenbergiella tayi TaxID=1432052 RepID=A0A1E3UBS1_9FIRM|nr:radical SAM protein [Eisenbergiella tayi]ODR46795.1 hypothetical protein BEI59_23905 [Eisenbergiella tayi]
MKQMNPLTKFYNTIDKGDGKTKIKDVPDFPRIIELEITNHCNFHCIMCKTGLDISGRGRGMMEKDIFYQLMNETKDMGDNLAIKFVGLGESLLSPYFIEFAKIAKKQGHICHLTTNGSKLTEKIMQELIDMEFDSVKFSFQGVDHESYAVMRLRDDFEELIEKIKRFKQFRGMKSLPFITIGTSLTNESEKRVNEFKKMCDDSVCDKLEIGMTNLEAIDVNLIKDEKTREVVLRLKQLQEMNKARLPVCNQVFDVITVRWNGNVCSCCADADGLMVLGNLKENSIKELWMSPKQKKYREILSENRYNDLLLCRDCYDFMGFMGSSNKKGD